MTTEEIKAILLEAYKDGKVVFVGYGGDLYSYPMENFLRQGADGILYDLNRGEETTLTSPEGLRWINDLAVAKVIRALKAKVKELETKLNEDQ